MIGCLDRPDGGSIAIDGIDVTAMPGGKLPELRSRKVGFIFQTFNLVPSVTALENVELPMRYAGVNGKNARQRALEVLAEVGLQDRAGHFPSELSGGRRNAWPSPGRWRSSRPSSSPTSPPVSSTPRPPRRS